MGRLRQQNVERDRLPPRDTWIYDPKINGRLETPLDERGLVDLDRLVVLAKQTIDPDFTWQSNENDVHHLQWPAAAYKNQRAVHDGYQFRELVNRKAYVPRLFHNWIHLITEPPPVPDEEVMHYSIDAQRVAMSLARTASLATQLTRRPGISQRELIHGLDMQFERYNLYMDNAREVPEEFRLIAINQIEAYVPEDLLAVNKKLGRLAIDRVPVIQRRVRQAA